MASQSVSVQVVTWNSALHLPAFFRSLQRQSRQPNQCIVVDNASSDQSVMLVRELSPAALVVENDRNIGFCAAHNRAIALSKSDFVLVVNPDIVLADDAIECMLRVADGHTRAGSIGGKIFRAEMDPAVLDTTGIVMSAGRKCSNRAEGEVDVGKYDTAEQVFGLSGAFVLYRRTALESVKIGSEYFDEDFFAYKDDADLAWRLRLAGWQNWYDPTIRAWHYRSVRSSDSFMRQEERKKRTVQNRLSYRNHLLMLIKNDRVRDWFFPVPRVLFYEAVKFWYLLLRERSTLLGILDMIRLLPAALRKRAIQRRQRETFHRHSQL